MFFLGAVAVISTSVLLYTVFVRPQTVGVPLQNEEKIVWDDYKGRKREITIHRKVKAG